MNEKKMSGTSENRPVVSLHVFLCNKNFIEEMENIVDEMDCKEE
jgi:hypothetical protein